MREEIDWDALQWLTEEVVDLTCTCLLCCWIEFVILTDLLCVGFVKHWHYNAWSAKEDCACDCST